ncbi:hypothetical protein V8B55DRAFT_1512467 [Mucor lusitanicus]
MMSYADHIICLLSSPADLDRLLSHLQVYSAASQRSLWSQPLPPSKIASRDHRQPEPGQSFLAVSQTGSNPTRSLLSFIEDSQVWVVVLSHPSRISFCPLLPYHLSLSSRSFHF